MFVLGDYEWVEENIANHYRESIVNISTCMEERFEEVNTSLFFKNLPLILDVKHLAEKRNWGIWW